MTPIKRMLQHRKSTTEEAMQIFDDLTPATLELMTGRWKGFEIDTGHPMNGFLEHSGWYGKLFINSEVVHPLLFYANNKTELYAVNPKLVTLIVTVPLKKKFTHSNILRPLTNFSRIFLQTRKSKARMRMIEYRGRVTGTMIYDENPIFDHFARIDEDTMLGVMDLKGLSQPYFFLLERDHTEYKLKLDF